MGFFALTTENGLESPNPTVFVWVIGSLAAIGAFILTIVALYKKINLVTGTELDKVKAELAAKIGSVQKKQDVLEEQHKSFVTRGELMTSRDNLFGNLTQRLSELSQTIHEVNENVHKIDDRQHDMGLKLETNLSKVWRSIDVMKERVRQLLRREYEEKEEDTKNGSDEDIKP